MSFVLCFSVEWFFDGIGSTIIGTLLGLIVGGVAGGFIGYRVSIKNKSNQRQKAGDNSNQLQVGNVNNINNGDVTKDERK